MVNQAVQFQNNSAVSRQSYGGNVICNNSTMSFSPFYLGSEAKPWDEESYSINQNWGVQFTFLVPLDQESVELCKSLGKRKLEKERLNFELVRIDNCTKFQQRGFMLRPGSTFEKLCSDVVPISLILKEQNDRILTQTNTD